MTSRRGAPSANTARYHRMKKTDDGFVDLQFEQPPPKVPWKAILLAVSLFIGGTSLIVVSALMLTGYVTGLPQSEWVMLLLGTLMFIPGFYHVRLAYFAFRSYPGYSYDDIPDFD